VNGWVNKKRKVVIRPDYNNQLLKMFDIMWAQAGEGVGAIRLRNVPPPNAELAGWYRAVALRPHEWERLSDALSAHHPLTSAARVPSGGSFAFAPLHE
jgi:hypothetical protein